MPSTFWRPFLAEWLRGFHWVLRAWSVAGAVSGVVLLVAASALGKPTTGWSLCGLLWLASLVCLAAADRAQDWAERHPRTPTETP